MEDTDSPEWGRKIVEGFLDKVRLALGTDGEVYIGLLSEDEKMFLYKVERNADFFFTLFNLVQPGKTEVFSGEGRSFAITIREVTQIMTAKTLEEAELTAKFDIENAEKRVGKFVGKFLRAVRRSIEENKKEGGVG